MQESGSRRVMANPGASGKCANASAAMRFERLNQPRLRAGIRTGQGSKQRQSAPSPCGEGDVTNDRIRSLLVSCGLLAFGTEFLALFAVKSLGVSFLRALKRCRAVRLFGLRCS